MPSEIEKELKEYLKDGLGNVWADGRDKKGVDLALCANAILKRFRDAGYLPVQEVPLEGLTEEEIAGICGKFSRPENYRQGLHLLAEMAATTQLSKLQQGGKLYRVKEE